MHRKRLLCWKAYLPRSSWPTQPTTPIICARPSLPKARSPSSPTTRHGRSNIRSTSISMPSAISWSAASQNSNNSAASQPASKRQPEITVPSSLSQPSSYGCDKCPHHLELGDRSEAEGTRLARRDVVVAIGGRPITLIEDVLDVELHSPVFVDLCVHACVNADPARQSDCVVRRGKRVGKIDHAKSCPPGRVDLVLVPPRELVIGHELDAIAGDDRCGGVAGDTCVRIGLAECRLPIRRDISGQGGLKAADLVASAREKQSVAAWICYRHIGAVEFIDRSSELQIPLDIPLNANFRVLEFLRLKN